MPNAIQILTTLEYLGPYPNVNRGADLYFGLVLQVGVGNVDTAAPNLPADVSRLLQPWTWMSQSTVDPLHPTPPDIQLWRVSGGAQPAKVDIVPVPIAGAIAPSITARLTNDCTDAIKAQDWGWTDPNPLMPDPNNAAGVTRRGDGRNIYPWPAHLSQIARYPYPIPHLLNLSFFLKVTANGFIAPGATDLFFATVTFKALVSNAYVNYSPQIPNPFPVAPGTRLTIPCSGDSTVFTTTQPLTSFTPAASLVGPAATLTPETTDWQSQLVAGTSDVFDLPGRLVNSVRKACDNPVPNRKPIPDPDGDLKAAAAANFTAYTRAVLNAHRQIVAFGCQPGPNGSYLLDRILNQWVAAGGQRAFAETFKKQALTQLATDTLKPIDAYDRWLLLLKTSPTLINDPLGEGLPAIPSGLCVYPSNSPYKKGATVIYHARFFTALRDTVSSTPGDSGSAADWACSSPSLLIYDTTKPSYSKNDQVLLQDSLYQATQNFSQVPPIGVPRPPSGASLYWKLISLPGINVANLPDRLVAVEHLHLQLSQPAVVIQLLLAQWTSIFNPQNPPFTSADSASFQSFLNSASANLPNYDVRGLLLQGNLGRSWTAIIAPTVVPPPDIALPASRESIASNLPLQLNSRLNNLVTITPGATPIGAALIAWLDQWLAGRLQTLVPGQLSTPATVLRRPPANLASPANPQPTRVSEGLSFMVDTLDDGQANDANSTLRSISGMCVLIRQSVSAGPPNSWRCLNVGNPVLGTPPDSVAGTPAVTQLTAAVIVPVPLHTQDGLRSATLTYNNQPLMATSPAHGFSAGVVPAQAPSGGADRLIGFQHPSVTTGLDTAPQWKIPGLAFGRSYDLLLGRVSNSGALPAQFTDAQSGPGGFSFASVGANFAPTIMSVPYGRTVPVSDLRFATTLASATTTFDKLKLPPIPDDVHPRASELYPSNSVTGTDLTKAPVKPSNPLVVLTSYKDPSLAPSQPTFTLSVRKPTIDLLTWDRTQAALDSSSPGTSVLRDLRIAAWTQFHTLARKQSTSCDLALDDPAIDSLSIQVTLNGSANNLACTGPATLPWGPSVIANPNSNSLQIAPPPINIIITAASSGNPILTGTLSAGGSSSWTLTLPPGNVAQITFTANLKVGINSQFASGISPSPKPYNLLVETASDSLPDAGNLFSGFNVLPPLTPAATSVDFTLSAPAATDVNYPKWLQVSRVDLQTQIWRWDGRPSSQFPFGKVVPIDYSRYNDAAPPPVAKQDLSSELLSWELETFGTRIASDATVRPMARTSQNAIGYEAHDDRGTELGATYYRAAVTAYNRYGSLVPANKRSSFTLNEFSSVPGTDGGWDRRFIPARITANASVPTGYKPPKPAIKYIVPLTGASDNSRPAASSVLVVVQGPWYAIAGLAEDISADLTFSSPDHQPQLPEAGPDPILFQDSKAKLPTKFPNYSGPLYGNDGVSNNHFHGPVGHTFDTSDANPLWITSSFVLDPPISDQGPAQEGTFARVQFSRYLHQNGILQSVLPQGAKKPILSLPASDFTSEATDPVWIQFLPSRFLPAQQSFDDLVTVVTAGQATIRSSTGVITLSAALNSASTTGADSPHRIFGLLLTEVVPDLLGRQGQERFVDLLLQASPGGASTSASWVFPNITGADTSNLLGRIIVIERQVNTSASCSDKTTPCALGSATELWNELFPPSSDPNQFSDVDAIARIVSVSPPIPASAPLKCSADVVAKAKGK